MSRRRPRARRVTQPMLVKPCDPAIEKLGFRCFRLFRVPRGFDVMAWFDHTHMMSTFARAA